MALHLTDDSRNDYLEYGGERDKNTSAPKHATIITAICVNGHENEIRPEVLDMVWYFKCKACGTIYVQSSRVSTQEIKGGLEHGPKNGD